MFNHGNLYNIKYIRKECDKSYDAWTFVTIYEHLTIYPLWGFPISLTMSEAKIDAFIQISWTMQSNKQLEINNVKLAFNYEALPYYKQCHKPKLVPFIQISWTILLNEQLENNNVELAFKFLLLQFM